MISGIIEFAAMTTAVCHRLETNPGRLWLGRRGSVKGVAITMLIGYPLLAVAYLTDRFGAFVEPIFFVCFSVMVAIELLEPRTATGHGRRGRR